MNSIQTTAWQTRLLNEFQRDFPLETTPYATMAHQLGVSEAAVLTTLAQQQAAGVISRIGAVVRPHSVGSSTLAALKVPEARLAEVAAHINEFPEVNHNYLREHPYNLWFVVTAADTQAVAGVLEHIHARTGLQPMSLPMQVAYHIDLGFDLYGQQAKPVAIHPVTTPVLTPQAHAVLAALAQGLGLQTRPYAALGARLGLTEMSVLQQATALLAAGVIKRLGVVVRHHELGFKANAMAVWDVPDAVIAQVGAALACAPGVHLCYQRRRWLPDWPYNLFCMVHGTARDAVLAHLAALNAQWALHAYPHAVLFSLRRYKQCGAQYNSAA